MTLEEAIKHCANKNCVLDHSQLAEWLTELQGYREQLKKSPILWMVKDKGKTDCFRNPRMAKLYSHEPEREYNHFHSKDGSSPLYIDGTLFKDLKWGTSPQRFKLINIEEQPVKPSFYYYNILSDKDF